jgi:hypothetical protein
MIYGPRITLRPLSQDDEDLVYECLNDWLDVRGPYTRQRAINDVGQGVKENLFSHYPVGDASDFFDNLVFEVSGNPFAFTRLRIFNRRVWVEHVSAKPEFRGKGLFGEMYRLYAYLVFEVYRADRVWFDGFEDVPALNRMREKLNGQTVDSLRQRDKFSDRKSSKWLLDREGYEAQPSLYAIDAHADRELLERRSENAAKLRERYSLS